MALRLSLNTNPLINRFAEVDDLVDTLAERIRIGYVQLTPEFVNPSWPAATIAKRVRQFRSALDRTGVKVTSVMTSTYGRLNHFGHPDADIRRYYLDWFRTLADISGELGAEGMGTQFAVFTQKDYNDPVRREVLIDIVVDCWRDVAEHAKAAGLSYIFWEPMSVGREFGHTIAECRSFDARLAEAKLPLPFKMIVDIDHGDVTSSNPDDVNPYAWAAAFPRESPIIHVKQSSTNKGGHWPFTAEHNKDGRIQPEKLIRTVEAAGGTDNEICMELSFREREPTDSNVVNMIRESVAYWEPHIDTGFNR
ncbi:erythrose 4-phosphate dehydrogenase [Mesorhizobium sanjuanii]|uniref:Erythrose 4-phosphate dehydrogenase n=1 Tax=Mesorhizobium sanjuanii TaxID=2037900 RepID=A0A2A6FA24_9HYPH|nr:TIM barrel protein [Mesorhizobium sanjuanii]PDQ18526.1 erythrose 4-phosphate dehydrogenase [Mesorhizobium sanjuanii]